jgi:Kef-type K+ transport system membrane component KefB
VAALGLLGWILNLNGGGNGLGALPRLAALVLAVFALERALAALIRSRRHKLLQLLSPAALFGASALLVLGMAALAEALGLHAVLGAFFAAMLIGQDLLGADHANLRAQAATVADGFFAPLFFALLGLYFSTSAFDRPGLLLAVLAVAVLSKLLGGWLGARLAGLPAREAWAVGAMLNGRGIMELVVARVGLEAGLIDQPLFSVLVFMGVATTALTPALFGKILKVKQVS